MTTLYTDSIFQGQTEVDPIPLRRRIRAAFCSSFSLRRRARAQYATAFDQMLKSLRFGF
jgi:hypothetical protein